METYKLGHLNVRSLVAHFDEFKNILLTNSLAICAITETWLNNNISSADVAIDGYNFIRNDRGARGGGVGIYLKSNLRYTVLHNIQGSEQIWIKIRVQGVDMAFSVLYRPPDYDYLNFFNNFETCVASIIPAVDNIFCLGDFNIDLNKYESKEAAHVLNILEGLDLKQLVNQPTRITNTSATLIDYIITSCENYVTETGAVSVPEVSDHELIVCKIKLHQEVPKPLIVRSRDFKNMNYEQFYNDLRSIPWNNIYDLDNINAMVEFINFNITTLLDLHAPYKEYRITKKYSPWLTDTLKIMMSDRDKALNKFKKSKENQDWVAYKALRNAVTLAVKREKKAYYRTKLYTNNKRDTWSALKVFNIGTKNKLNNLPDELSDVENINNFFIKSVPSLNVNQDLTSYYENNIKTTVTSFMTFKQVSEIEVLKTISNIKSKATGCDGINIFSINLCLPHILPHITYLINFCLKNSVFPDQWSKALVVPLPKVSNITGYHEIRPISILPALSKVLEKVMEAQLQSHIKSNQIIPESQSGFKRGHSCTTSLLHITDDILRANDEGKLTVLILLDYSKAFDMINHKLLLSILKYIGLMPSAILMIARYLSNRSQAVKYHDNTSSFLRVSTGVPQGSVLGPLLFSIYISKFENYFLSCNQHYYADDTQIYMSFYPNEYRQAVTAINYDLNTIYHVSQQHCLKLNPNKSSMIIFGNKNHKASLLGNNEIKVCINNEPISIYDSVKNLGLIIDSELRFTKHISKCLQKAYLNLKLIYQNRMFFDRTIKKMLCETLILSHFNYCDVVYNSCLRDFDIKRIQKMQNSCLRLIYGIRKYNSISSKFKEIGWLNMKNRRILHSASLYYSILSEKSPPYLYRKIQYRSDVHNINLRYKGTLTPPTHSTESYKRSFSYCITYLYNNLPQQLKCVTNGRRFKTEYFKYLLSRQNA